MMAEDRAVELVEEAMNPEEFDVLDYLDDVPIAEDTVDIYVDVAASKQLDKLMDDRAKVIAQRRAAAQRGENVALSLDEGDEDTEYDDEINALVNSLEETKITFHLKSVAPSLEKAIKKSYIAKADPNASPEERAAYEEKMYADILSRAIDYAVLGGGSHKDTKPWTPERLTKLQEKLYEAQSTKLLTALSTMVYVGEIFDGAISVDF